MTPALYEIAGDFQALEAKLYESGGEITPDVEAALEALGELEASKVDAYRVVVRQFEAHATDCRAEIDILSAKVTAASNAAKRLKERLQLYMETRGVTELKGHIWKAAIQKNGGKPAVKVLVEPTALPTGLQRITVEADADRIRAVAGQDGRVVVDEVEVARVEPVGSHLRFR